MASVSTSGTNLRLLIWQEQWLPGIANPPAPGSENLNAHCALWLQSGRIERNEESVPEGSGFYLGPDDRLCNSADDAATLLRFVVGKTDQVIAQSNALSASDTTSSPTRSLIFTQNFTVDLTDAIMRLDQVDFPPGAIAYKHTHPGAGARYLVFGGLQLQSEHGNEFMNAGDAWFEDANSAVQATAREDGHSRFVRMMLLPVEFEGQPTSDIGQFQRSG